MANAYLIQMHPSEKGKEESFAHAREMVLNAHPIPGSLILFPEMFATGFLTHPKEDLAEDISGETSPTVQFLQNLSDETRCDILGGGIAKFASGNFRFQNWTGKFAPKAFDSSMRYFKRHPFAGEAELFAPGNEFAHFDWAGFLGFPFLCFDLRFPEDFRRARAQGATLFTVQAEWPASRELHFKTLLRARSIENQCYVLACARAGKDFSSSYAFGPNGEEILAADKSEGVFCVSLNAQKISEARKNFPLPEPNF